MTENTLTDLNMRVGLGQFDDASDEQLSFVKQCGVDDFLLNTPKLPGKERWEFQDLLQLRTRAENAGLRLMSLENVPMCFYDKIMLGLEGRDAQLTNMSETIRNMGKAGIPILGYHFMPGGVWRTSDSTPVRGGALATSFEMTRVANAPLIAERSYTEEEMWDHYDWYLERILPVCEEANVRLALHPDDPPVPAIGGIARLFRNFENFKRALEVHDSPMHGLDFCHGCWSEMRGGKGVIEAIEYFAQRDQIFYVHLRDVQGTVDNFTECWIGEGNSNILQVLQTLKRTGFKGFMIPDHVPRMTGDTPWCHRGRAYTVGYMKALLSVLDQTT
ncbi:MAG: mannonate dehydratase [Planctomycetes bacterium]|nr:mannonate dehydratase [Planctomycetota bacterium]